MGIWLNILVSLATGLFLVSSAQADETAKRIQSAIEKIEGSMVGVRYKLDTSGTEGMSWGGGREGRRGSFTMGFEGARMTSGVVTNEEGFIAISSDATRNPLSRFRWGGRGSGSSSNPSFKELTIVLSNGEERVAHLAGHDSERNLAFLQLEDATGLQPVKFASEGKVGLAEQVIVIARLSQRESSTTKFLLTRINAIVEGDSPSYSTMDDLGDYNGGIVANLKGEVIGIVGRPPAPKAEDGEEDLVRGVRRIFGRGGDLRIIPGSTLQGLFAKPPIGLLPREGEEDQRREQPAETEKEKPKDKPKEKSGDDY